MRSRIRRRRHLGLMLPAMRIDERTLIAKGAAAAITQQGAALPAEFTPHQYVIFLLHIAAELEHVLMVEYLYAGFSLGGPRVPVERQAEVAQWQEIILGIGKEEMGHLMTIQNLLRCLGGPLNLDREDYPWDSEFYPFPFRLEPLTRGALAKYIFAESPAPEEWTGNEADEIRALAQEGVGSIELHRVGELYSLIKALLEDHDALKDSDFRSSTYPFQANWDEWGRGYQRGARGNAMGGAMAGTPDMILMPVTCRSDAIEAIKAVATQGEANPTGDEEIPSHFARFLRIYRQFPKDGSWSPSRNVPVDPIVMTKPTDNEDSQGSEGSFITHPEGRLWAQLFNVRYRTLLTGLLHTFDYSSNISESSQMTPRGLLVHSTFGEMYNLRAISHILVQTPLAADGSDRVAGPPFQMPYTLNLPFDRADRWRLHLDLLQASRMLVDRLLVLNQNGHRKYLLALGRTDDETISTIETILTGNPIPSSMR